MQQGANIIPVPKSAAMYSLDVCRRGALQGPSKVFIMHNNNVLVYATTNTYTPLAGCLLVGVTAAPPHVASTAPRLGSSRQPKPRPLGLEGA